MFKTTLSRTVALVSATLLTAPAFAQTATPFDTLMDAIALSDMTTKIVAIGVLIIGIAVAFKAVTVAKRAVSKV